MTQRNDKPVQQIRLGNVKASIWRFENGEVTRHNVTFSRRYQRDGEWRDSQSFGRDELPRLMKCADLAYDWIFNECRQSSGRSADRVAHPVEAQS